MRIKKSFGDKSLDGLMTRLSAARTSAGGSPVQWHGFAVQLLIPVFESAVEFQGSVSETDRGELIRDAIFGAATETKFDREALVRHLRRAENSYLQKPPQKFILATSWTASPGLKMKPVRSDRATVSFSPLSRTRLDREPIRNLVEKVTPFPVPEMLQVQARVTARTPSGGL